MARSVLLVRSVVARTNVGSSWAESWTALLAGRRAFADVRSTVAGLDDDPPVTTIAGWAGKEAPERRGIRLAAELGEELRPAVEQQLRRRPRLRLELIVATSHGEPGSLSAIADLDAGLRPAVPPTDQRAVLTDRSPGHVLAALGHRFPASTLAAACASTIVAAVVADRRIRHGLVDGVIVVSFDVLSRIGYAGFRQVGAMSATGCRPFSVDHDGTTVGEGGVGFLLVRDDASSNEETVTLLGAGMGCQAGTHAIEPSSNGVTTVMRRALTKASLDPSDIRAVVWHGSGTAQNDVAEAVAAAAVFGSRGPLGTATKGTFGHAMGASAGLGLLTAAAIARTGVVPPAAGVRAASSGDLRLVVGRPRRIEQGPVMSVALGFGGINSAIIVGLDRG